MFSLADLKYLNRPERPALVDGLISAGTINLLVGDTGIGKTPLGLQLGLAIASGEMFLDNEVQQGRVLFIDAESGLEEFRKPLLRLAEFLGIPENVPFFAYNRDWDEREILPESWEPLIEEQIKAVKPSLVIIDPLRAIWPLAETKSDECMRMISKLRGWSRQLGVTFVITHHVRKDSQDIDPRNKPDLLDDPQGWLQAAAGTRALVTSADTRIGVAKPPKGARESEDVALLMCGYTRLRGTLPPVRLQRIRDAEGEAVGYSKFVNLEGISVKEKAKFDSLPNPFRMQDLREMMNSSRAAQELAKKFVGSGLAMRNEKTKLYLKCG